jgi:hypothetical protein
LAKVSRLQMVGETTSLDMLVLVGHQRDPDLDRLAGSGSRGLPRARTSGRRPTKRVTEHAVPVGPARPLQEGPDLGER